MSAIALNITLKSTSGTKEIISLTPVPIVIMSEEVISQDNPELYIREFLRSPSAEGIKQICLDGCKTVSDWLCCAVYCRVVDDGGSARLHINVSSVWDLPLDRIRFAMQQIMNGDPKGDITEELPGLKIPVNLDDGVKLRLERIITLLGVSKSYPEFYSKCMDKLMYSDTE